MPIDLKALSARESEQVEWKENVADALDVVETIVAFANDLANLGGGYVVCGAREARDEHGFQRVELLGMTAERCKAVEGTVLNACLSHVDPPLHPLVEEVHSDDEGRRVIVFVVPASPHAHSFRRREDGGKHYVRIGRETKEARNGILRELLVRKGATQPWDRQVRPNATVDDLDLLALRDLLTRIGVWDPARGIEAYLDPNSSVSPLVPSFCAREGITGVSRPRNFALLLLAREPHRFFPDAHAIFSLYPGLDRSEPYSERTEITGTLLSQIERLLALLDTQAYMLIDKSEGAAPNVVKYPRRALHEAVVNALVHRDYAAHHPTRVTAFADRIEIHSPGGLPTAVAEAEFVAGRAMPVWRNQSLAWLLNKLQLAQAEGQGVATILRTMAQEGCPDPVFRVSPESVSCTLPAHPRHARMRDLQDIERLFAVGQFEVARAKVDAILVADPFNTRAIQLMCDVERAARTSERVVAFVERHATNLASFSSAAQLLLADALTELAERDDSRAHKHASTLLRLAAQGKFEAAEVRRLCVTLFRMNEVEAVVDLLGRQLADHPAWEMAAWFLQLRGRAWVQLAKRCSETARQWNTPPRLRARAWQECRGYLEKSESDLRASLAHAPDDVIREHAHRDLEFVETLKRRAERPDPRRGR